jgi:hypothetical protein
MELGRSKKTGHIVGPQGGRLGPTKVVATFIVPESLSISFGLAPTRISPHTAPQSLPRVKEQ